MINAVIPGLDPVFSAAHPGQGTQGVFSFTQRYLFPEQIVEGLFYVDLSSFRPPSRLSPRE